MTAVDDVTVDYLINTLRDYVENRHLRASAAMELRVVCALARLEHARETGHEK